MEIKVYVVLQHTEGKEGVATELAGVYGSKEMADSAVFLLSRGNEWGGRFVTYSVHEEAINGRVK